MWSCPYCGNHSGVKFKDMNLQGMLCMHPDCGRFNELDEAKFAELNLEENESWSFA
ncbi:hypothetical protein [Ammoniphilus sp. CFH 90114]|uniref:hypothetical protein n=1 Tax=Ammoniphilus sp. CFH 90114 TaxID=2493665 RepID=UPI0013E91AB9|nr:hypothetical protein [Ammoniphilus sp. CFH 90114]